MEWGLRETKCKLHPDNARCRRVAGLSMFECLSLRTLNVLKDLNWISQSLQYRSPSLTCWAASLSSDSSVVVVTDDSGILQRGGGRGTESRDPFHV